MTCNELKGGKGMKKIAKNAMCLAMCLTIVIPSVAFAEPINVEQEEMGTLNELEYLLEVQELSRDELKSKGLSSNEITELKEFSIEEAYLERAELPYETLIAYGYTDEQIEILKNYDGSPITAESEMMALAAKMSVSKFTAYQASTSGFTVKYKWEWDSVPINRHTDRVVIYWRAYDSQPQEVDVTPSQNTAKITYFNLISGTERHSQVVNGAYSSLQNAVYVDVGLVKGTTDDEYWAKKGEYTLRVEKTGSSALSYVKFGASYGHDTVSFTGDLSFTIGTGFALTFSGSSMVDKVTNISCTYSYDGKLTNHGEFDN